MVNECMIDFTGYLKLDLLWEAISGEWEHFPWSLGFFEDVGWIVADTAIVTHFWKIYKNNKFLLKH